MTGPLGNNEFFSRETKFTVPLGTSHFVFTVLSIHQIKLDAEIVTGIRTLLLPVDDRQYTTEH